MRTSDVICPASGAGYRRIELATRPRSRDEFCCLVCDQVLELFDLGADHRRAVGAVGMLLKIILVVAFGRPERLQGHDLGRDPMVVEFLLRLGPGLFRGGFSLCRSCFASWSRIGNDPRLQLL